MSSTTLKLFALIFMLIDHVAEFIPGMPIWMHWLGRIAAPIFMFCLVWSMKYTKNPVRYLLRMYLGGLVMGIMDFVINLLYKNPYAEMSNNFFTTLFLIGLCIFVYEMYRDDKASGKRLLIIIVIEQLVSLMMCYSGVFAYPNMHFEYLFNAIFPNFLYTEGGFLVVVLGILFYWYRDEPKWMAGTYAAACVVYCLLVFLQNGFSVNAIFTEDYQWMMILAVPFFLAYNGKKGKGLKYLFYVFYPVHILALFLIGNYM